MLVSIIVPIYNSEKYLEKCVVSIQRQTYKKIEIILVNDGSTDNSLSICKKLKEMDKRIKIVSQKNMGLIAARKIGVEQAGGELIGFVDSDDWIEPTFYEKMLEIYLQYECDLISTGIIRDYVDTNRKEVLFDNYIEGCYRNLGKEIYSTMIYNNQKETFGLYCNLVNKLFKRKLLKKIYDNINTKIFYGEDCLTLYRYCLLAESIYILKEAYYHYNIRNNSMCRTTDVKLLENGYMLYQELEYLFKQHEQKYVLMRQLKKFFLMSIFSHNLEMLYGYNIAALGTWKHNYQEEIYKSKIVIYGAGGCGQALYSRFVELELTDNVVAWLDKDWQNKCEECLFPIREPECLNNLLFDYIIIAVQDEELANDIKKSLIEMYSLSIEKIIWEKPEFIPLFGNVYF